MNGRKLTGWKDVFAFTLRQTTGEKAFKVTTFVFALILFLLPCIGNIMMGGSSKKDNTSPITVVHVLDESGLTGTDFNQLSKLGMKAYQSVSFVAAKTGKTEEELLKEIGEKSNTQVLLHITKEGEGFAMNIAIPVNSSIKVADGNALLNQIVPLFKSGIFTQVGLTGAQLQSLNMPVTTSYHDAGEATKSIGEILIKMFAPMLFCLILYMMILLYGQTICKTLVTEKTSKLMELLLTSATPYALITGKILSMTFLAIFQFLLWIGSSIVGFAVGDSIAKGMYPEYNNKIITILSLIKDNTNASAFSLSSIILAIIGLSLGFLFYSVLAGLVGAILNKAEDLSSGMAIFQLPVIASFLAAYFITLKEDATLIGFVRLFPFTSPFTVPADLVIGNMGLAQGCISLIILLISTSLLIMLAGKLYKGLVLFNGNKINLKNIMQILKAKM